MTLASQLHDLRLQERALRRRGFIPIAGAARASVLAHVGTHQFVNTFGVLLPSADSGAMQTLADAVANAWFGHIMAGPTGTLTLTNAYMLDSVVLTDQSSQTGGQAISTQHAGSTGTGVDTAYPLSTAAVVSLRTGHRGRDHRGRLYIGPVGPGSGDRHGPSPTAVSYLIAAFQTFNTALAAAGSGLAILSRVNNPGAAYPVTNVLVNGTWGSQRRRLQ